MKKKAIILLSLSIALLFGACEGKETTSNLNDEFESVQHEESTESSENVEENNPLIEMVTIKASPDKYTWYIKNYVGKNCASLGYTSMGGDRFDRYGEGLLELVFVCSDGTYIDVESEENLKEYIVIGQNLEPNTELKLVFDKDSEGNEYDNLVACQSYEEILLSVKKVGTEAESVPLTTINPSPDKYTWYISDYVGRNLKGCGYISMGGDLMDRYGEAVVELRIVAEDGSYVDSSDEDVLKSYVVIGQSVAPNTELKLVFEKDSEGVEYDNLVESQNIEEIEVYVKRLEGAKQNTSAQEESTPSEEIPLKEADDRVSSEQLADGMRPDFKEAMDSYEAFYDEYCDFMKKYNENPGELSLIMEYADMLTRSAEMTKKFEEWNSDDLNDAEMKYYLEVNTRVSQKLLEVAY